MLAGPDGAAGPGSRPVPDGVGAGIVAGAARWSGPGATVYRLAGDGPVAAAARALERIDRATPFATAPVVGSHGRWLVTAVPQGQPADRPERHPDPDELVTAVGSGLRALHDLASPSRRLVAQAVAGVDGPSTVAQRCRDAVRDGLVDPARLPEPYRRHRPERLLELFLAAGAEPGDDQPVACHGAATLARFRVAGGRFSGFDRLEAPLLADRHLDLATLHLDLQAVFGPDAVFRFYEAYGRDPDLVRLDRHVLAAHLLGLTPPAATTAGPAAPAADPCP